MATAWRRPIPARERVMFFGGGGAGKTYAALCLAARALGPDDRLFVIDYDNAVGVILGAGQFDKLVIAEEWDAGELIWENPEGGNVIILHGDTWADLAWMNRVMAAQMTRDSWVIVDSITRLWEEVQNWYLVTMHGEDMAGWLLDFKREQMAKNAGQNQDQAAIGLMLDGAWQVINKEWASKIKNPILTVPKHHVVVTAEEKPVRTASGDTGKDSEELAGMYRHLGLKPDTQKSVGHKVATVVHLTKGKQREPVRRMTVVKDWGYEQAGVVGEENEYEDMGVTLLKDMHGWRPRKVD